MRPDSLIGEWIDRAIEQAMLDTKDEKNRGDKSQRSRIVPAEK